MNNDSKQVLSTLFNLKTIRTRAHHILDLAKENKLEYFSLNEACMMPTASFVIEVITNNYPSLDVPYHSRWRHFEAGGIDRIQKMQAQLAHCSAQERGAILYELVIISVFLDAGAGSAWHYTEAETGQIFTRSEGLALASLAMYQKGMFSLDPKEPYRVDAQKLIDFSVRDLEAGFQVSAQNPLEGVTGRVALLNRLGAVIKEKTSNFGTKARLGDFYAYVSAQAINNTLSATSLFNAVLQSLNEIWPARLTYEGVSLGDVWIHKALKTTQSGSEYMPFHKLSQWLTYSLIEPLEQADIQVTDLDELTGLPEYRNGGLFIDTGLLSLKNQDLQNKPHEPGSELIVEWRALTVALLDELAQLIRQQLNQDARSLPLAKILQGGTWEAGRRIAKQKRSAGTPPLNIISDGTVF